MAIVDDEGAGIPEEDLKKIFDRFTGLTKRAQEQPAEPVWASIIESAVHHCNGTVEAKSRKRRSKVHCQIPPACF